MLQKSREAPCERKDCTEKQKWHANPACRTASCRHLSQQSPSRGNPWSHHGFLTPAWEPEWEDSKCSSSDGEWVALGAVRCRAVRFCDTRQRLRGVTLTAAPLPSTPFWGCPAIFNQSWSCRRVERSPLSISHTPMALTRTAGHRGNTGQSCQLSQPERGSVLLCLWLTTKKKAPVWDFLEKEQQQALPWLGRSVHVTRHIPVGTAHSE